MKVVLNADPDGKCAEILSVNTTPKFDAHGKITIKSKSAVKSVSDEKFATRSSVNVTLRFDALGKLTLRLSRNVVARFDSDRKLATKLSKCRMLKPVR